MRKRDAALLAVWLLLLATGPLWLPAVDIDPQAALGGVFMVVMMVMILRTSPFPRF